jgi:hypothetical protein
LEETAPLGNGLGDTMAAFGPGDAAITADENMDDWGVEANAGEEVEGVSADEGVEVVNADEGVEGNSGWKD